MRFRFQRPGISEEDERQAAERLTASLRNQGYTEPTRLPDAVRNNLLVRTNREIDRVSSGRAISLSWAARVAIPGVVAIIAFFTALHYYGTPTPQRPSTLTPLISGISDSGLDSLLAEPAVTDSSLVLAAAGDDLFSVPGDLAAEYLMSGDRTSVVLQTMSDKQIDEVMAILSSEKSIAL